MSDHEQPKKEQLPVFEVGQKVTLRSQFTEFASPEGAPYVFTPGKEYEVLKVTPIEGEARTAEGTEFITIACDDGRLVEINADHFA